MKNANHWELTVESRNREDLSKLIKHLADSDLYEYTVEPVVSRDSYFCSVITISGCWTNNLKSLCHSIDELMSEQDDLSED